MTTLLFTHVALEPGLLGHAHPPLCLLTPEAPTKVASEFSTSKLSWVGLQVPALSSHLSLLSLSASLPVGNAGYLPSSQRTQLLGLALRGAYNLTPGAF